MLQRHIRGKKRTPTRYLNMRPGRPSDGALSEISALYPNFSPRQVVWLAGICDDRNTGEPEKVVASILCELAGPLLVGVDISNKKLDRMAERCVNAAHRIADGETIDRHITGLPTNKDWLSGQGRWWL